MTAWTFAFNGVTFDDASGLGVAAVAGLGFPEVSSSDRDRPATDGMFAGRDLGRGRQIDIDLIVTGATTETREAIVATLRAATVISRSTEKTLTFTAPGAPTKRISCRVRRRAIPLDVARTPFSPTVALQLFATDPRIYADTASAGSTGPPTVGTGLTFNATPDFSFGGAASGGFITAVNAGDYPAPWTATITGPVTNPSLQLLETGQVLTLTGVVDAGTTLVLDSANRSILLGGTASRYYFLQAGSTWFDLAPGTNTIRYNASAGTGTLDLAWRSSWL